MQCKAAAIAGVNNGVLRFVGVVDHTIFAVLDVSMNFDMIVGTEPVMQAVFIVCSPQDRTMKDAAVCETIRQTAEINTATVAVFVNCQLNFLPALNQDLGAFQCKDALFAFAEVDVMIGAGRPFGFSRYSAT